MDYDTLMKLELRGRLRAFESASARNKAQLMSTHIERWIAKNRARLTTQQLAVMQDNLAFVTPDTYEGRDVPAAQARARALEQRTAALFSRDEMTQAISLYGDYLPAPTP
jgi:hypothetical protein